jgi:2-keto-4-pentenoate hydratase/2-oxohepta-3-ene-1,7-dioic acid hydratase in catechol pathway
MRLCRFTLKTDNAALPRLGLMEEDGIRDVTAITSDLPTLHWPFPRGDQLIANLAKLRLRMEALAEKAPLIARKDVKLLSPIANPEKFICGVGNWKHHGAPLGMMGFLFKMTSAAAGEGDGVQIRWPDRATLHEPELAIVIGKTCINVTEAEALNHVAGYSCALDMTMKEEREFFSFCKSFDTYGVLGPCLVTADEIPDPSALDYRFWVNGELRGERRFADLTGSPAQLVAFASTVMTLEPGDVIFCGAADVAPVVPGDLMTLEIPRIGRIDVPVTLSPHARAPIDKNNSVTGGQS